jgi:hypothetical protein
VLHKGEAAVKADDLKLYASTITAMILAIGAPILLVWVLIQPAGTMDETAKAGITALLGGMSTYGIQFLFGRDIAAGSARQTERAMGVSASNLDFHAYEDALPPEDLVPHGVGDVDNDPVDSPSAGSGVNPPPA